MSYGPLNTPDSRTWGIYALSLQSVKSKSNGHVEGFIAPDNEKFGNYTLDSEILS
uniref:Uncharacterized protein n=1 Tax=Candidatus Kentrum sp. TUN TaxID=2126343 RepID=A0A451A6D2_9GAMM|nr:MAG: hypothetical protein BECKTUN1418F_GA0071002_12214 [Candidatus Kentron sp. TUN]VFK61586.1 MAG: hypothetical protein BECKTUN1418D_GA0071000_11559 [Candidatus Kentron sp. TUN]VFK70009.1 MAG: hypothetical protein BECKTUN1418E_GA0071001_12263 [Candidatus Kentron sp. TUN]